LTQRTETILLFGLSDIETWLVNRLVSSFEIETESMTLGKLSEFQNNSPKKKICLVVFHVDEKLERQHLAVRRIRQVIGDLVPLLILVPREKVSEIKRFLKAGGDDYIPLPLNTNRFSLSFLILLEIGQAIAQSPQAKEPSPGEYVWNRLVNYFQDDFSYFTPKSLTQRQTADNLLNKWKQIRRLGLGGFGVVWLVEEIGTGRLAVAKTPHSSQMNISALRSAAILKRLSHHPNIAQLFEVIKHNGKFILIQEFVEGSTLQDLIEEGIEPKEKETLFLQLLSAIAYSHGHKIIHRDIKPENIIISKTGQLKLLDFGIAQDLSWQVPSKSSEGTLNFMAPEQYEGRSCIASDVWALGVILFILATNSVPYYQSTDKYPVDLEATLRERTPRKLNPKICVKLNTIIMACLETDLAKRYKTGAELQTDLQKELPGFGSGLLLPL